MSKDFTVIGHRGARGLYPENTLGSIQRALEIGVDMVEVDVHVCKSGEVVVIHDDKLERTTNGTGYVRNRSLDYLKGLDAGNGENIPTLCDVLDLIDCRIGLNVELKGYGTLGPVLRTLELYVRNKGWSHEQFIISTFMRKKLKRLARSHPKFRIGALLAYRPWGFISFAEDIRAYSIHPNLKVVNPAMIETAHGKGLKVFVWTVNEPDDIERMKAWGVDGVFSDFPDRL